MPSDLNRYSLAEPPAEVVDKTVLSAIVACCAYKQAHYTVDSYVAYMSALTSAQGVLGSDTATQEEVDAAVALLQDAIGGLVEEISQPADSSSSSSMDTNASSDEKKGCGSVLGAEIPLALLCVALLKAKKKEND